jgi:molybdopterin biosynthesis enzyme
MEQLVAYDLKAKQKEVPFVEVTISKTSRGGYIAKGTNASGNKMTTILSEAKALAAIEAGIAKQDF